MTGVRHSALFVWSDDVGDEQKLRAKEGVAYCWFGSDVLTFDFGEDLGVAPTRHGFSLQHDHGDRAAWEAYNENAAHARAGAYLKSITRPELAARVDWEYEGPPSRRGAVRHLALYRWGPRRPASPERSEKRSPPSDSFASAVRACVPSRSGTTSAGTRRTTTGWSKRTSTTSTASPRSWPIRHSSRRLP